MLATSQKIKDAGIELSLIVAAPDAKAGRGQKLTPPPVKIEGEKLGIEIWQPEDLKIENCELKIKKLNPGLIILAAYGKILPQWLIALPQKGALNIHPSLLPKYRGATPLQTALLNGDMHTGVSLIVMDEKVDHGPIIAQEKVGIAPQETYSSLEEKTAKLGAALLEKTLPSWLEGKITTKLQDDSQGTQTQLIKKQDGKINWNKSAIEIERQIRAFEVWPGSVSDFNAQPLKIIKASVSPEETSATPGTALRINGKIGVATGDGILILETVQPSGKKQMGIEDFLRGHKDFIGSRLL